MQAALGPRPVQNPLLDDPSVRLTLPRYAHSPTDGCASHYGRNGFHGADLDLREVVQAPLITVTHCTTALFHVLCYAPHSGQHFSSTQLIGWKTKPLWHGDPLLVLSDLCSILIGPFFF